MSKVKQKISCSDCHTKYSVEWDSDEQYLDPITCPFCGHEIIDNGEDEYEEPEREDDYSEDSWN